MRILLVEDHDDTVRIIARLLGTSGHDVTTAARAAEAERLCAERTFDLLVCDISLPDRDGWELLARLRRAACDTPAIALSGHGFDDDVRKSAAAGFAAHLTKPVSFARLLAAIHELAARPSAGAIGICGDGGGDAIGPIGYLGA